MTGKNPKSKSAIESEDCKNNEEKFEMIKEIENMNGDSKKSKKKKNKDLAVEALSNALKALPADQQVATLLSKYAEMVEENRKLQASCNHFEKATTQAVKEKDKAELDLSKAILSRSRLESLCRELQKQNKLIKEENLTRLKEEEEKRKEVSGQFNTTLSEISHLMEENTAKNSKLREENQDMATRLKDLIVQMEARENHVEKVVQQKELEVQLAEAKYAKLQIEKTEKEEILLCEKKKHLEDLSLLHNKLEEKSLAEIDLRTQLNNYTCKYEEFQSTLDKSNEIFKTFKKEMDEMSKTMKKQEKEVKVWKSKADDASKASLEMFNERTLMEEKVTAVSKQNDRLQSLCRALQKQVGDLRSKLKESGLSDSVSEAEEANVANEAEKGEDMQAVD